jgi:hypothetical protein
MKKFSNSDPKPNPRQELLERGFARRIAVALTEQLLSQPRQDVNERLRFAREQALARARETRRLSAAPALALGAGSAMLVGGPDGETPWWLRLSSLLPLAILLAGLLLIDDHYTRTQIEAAAEVDAAILADDLPPEAYSDPGFVEFLTTVRQ